jgi:hypothetical protein
MVKTDAQADQLASNNITNRAIEERKRLEEHFEVQKVFQDRKNSHDGTVHDAIDNPDQDQKKKFVVTILEEKSELKWNETGIIHRRERCDGKYQYRG